MDTSYQLLITTSDQVFLEVQFLNQIFEINLPDDGKKIKKISFESDQETFELKIKLFGKLGSSAQITLIRIEGGFSWSETIRILKNDVAIKTYSLDQSDFTKQISKTLEFKTHKYFGDGDREFKGDAIVPVPYEKSSVVEVFYGTNRQAVAKQEGNKFQDYNGVISNMKYGRCEVNIPFKRKIGELPRPEWWKLEFRERLDKHFMILEGSELSGDRFFTAVSSLLSIKNDALVFIHGFNTDFEESILRTAQISFDLGYNGVPVSFSWPSNGSVLSYEQDEESIKDSCESIIEFLKDLRFRAGAERINIIAHSMGNRGLTAALARLQEEQYFKDFVYNQVILAAPDIDAQVFLDELAPKMKGCANRLTLYASSKDKALQVSRSKDGSIIRLGESGDMITYCDCLDTIDASRTDPSFLGHGYFASTTALINDIFLLINHNPPPSERNLLLVETGVSRFWKFR